ncbi:hypothetical protein JMG10_34245 [Nostoc ellipsosporum NOK]|nr:hypothetical protein [Nostoc ellipsosporum NOK]
MSAVTGFIAAGALAASNIAYLDYPNHFPGAAHCPILIGCEESGIVRDAFLKRGFDAWSCDLKPDRRGSNRHIQGDIRDQLNRGRWRMILIAHPPCTRLCNSGVRWLSVPPPGKTLKQMWAELDEGAALFSDVWNSDAEHIAAENPVMHCHARERIENYEPAAQHVQPWWFGDPQFKSTGWYLRRLPKLVPTKRLTPPAKGTEEHKAWSKVHRAPPGPDRAALRSTFFPGMSEACADQWGRHILALPPAFELAA